jgi:hypothetical protein
MLQVASDNIQVQKFDVEPHCRMHEKFSGRFVTLHEWMQNMGKRGVEQTMFGIQRSKIHVRTSVSKYAFSLVMNQNKYGRIRTYTLC